MDDANAPRRTLDDLRRDDASFRLLVESVRDYAIFLLDPEGRVASWNEGARRIKGYTEDEILGESFERFYPPEAVATGFPKHELEVAAREGRFEDEGWRVRKDGSQFWANVVITALHDADGELIGFAKVTRDLTERREAEDARAREAAADAAREEAERQNATLTELNDNLRKQSAELEAQAEELEQQAIELEMLNDRLEEANHELQEALERSDLARQDADRSAAAATAVTSAVSHDLRNPLNAIVMASALLAETGGVSEKGRAQLDVIQRAGSRMTRLIEDLLDIAKAEGSGMRIEPRTEAVGALIDEASDGSRLQAGQLGLDLRVDVQPHLPRVYVDRGRVLQVMSNLLDNAFKFTPRGGVVTLRAARRDDAVEFSVSDTGAGIPAADVEHVFDRFWQARRASRAGAGLGLAIARSIVEAHGGTIEVDSTEGVGSTFRFTMPIAR